MPARKKKVFIVADELRRWTQPVGQIVATHGLKGAVKVRPLHGAADQLFTVGAQFCLTFPSGRRQPLTIQTCFPKGAVWIVKFMEMDSIAEAERAVGLLLTVQEGWKPRLQEDEFLLSELEGMDIVTEEGEAVGKVIEVLESPAHDLLVTERGMIPMVKEFVKKVDRKQRRITVRLPKGLLSEEVPKKPPPQWQK